jgi:hypothetical protein
MVVNLVCVPVIYILYPETKGRSLEDMDTLFGGKPSVTAHEPDDTEGLATPKASRSTATTTSVS